MEALSSNSHCAVADRNKPARAQRWASVSGGDAGNTPSRWGSEGFIPVSTPGRIPRPEPRKGMAFSQNEISVSHENAMPNGVPDAARPHCEVRSLPAERQPSPLDPFSDNQVASRASQMTRRAVGTPCSSPPDGVITPPSGEPPGPSPSGGHEKHPGLAATRLTFAFQHCWALSPPLGRPPTVLYGMAKQPDPFPKIV